MSAPGPIDSPGPGTYNTVKKAGCDMPSYTLKPKIPLQRWGADNPGPGTYTPSRTQIHKPQAPSHSLGPRVSRPSFTDDVPGPGTYEADPRLGHGPKFTLKSRIVMTTASAAVPGPGAYEEIGNLSKGGHSLKYSMLGRPKQKGDAQGTPGPGSYEAHSVFNPKSARKAYSLGGKLNRKEHDDGIPGPATYYPASTIGQAPTAKIGHTLKDLSDPSHVERSPGPATYYPDGDMGKGNKKSFGSVLAPRSNGHDNPGPGTYTPTLKIARKSAPKFSLGPKTTVRSFADDVPPPGTYELVKPFGSGKRAAGLHQRIKNGSQSARTLGHPYNPQDQFTGNKYSMRGRVYSINYDNNNAPGPGAYDIKSNIGTRGQPFTSRRDDNTSKNADMPAPNTYHPASASTAPKYSLGAKHKGASTLYASSSNPMQGITNTKILN